MKSHNETILTSNDEKVAENLLNGIREIIDTTRRKAMVYVNQQVSWQYYSVGKFIVENLHADTYADYGQRIVATVSQQLQNEYGKGYSYSALTRMRRVAICYSTEMFATVSQTLTWS